MTARNRESLKTDFENGRRPSGDDFADLFESFLNKKDDGLSVEGKDLHLTGGVRLGNIAGASAGMLRFNGSAVQFHDGTTWVSVASGAVGVFQPVGDENENAVAYSAGNVGINTGATAPTYRLEVELGENTATAEQVRFGNVVCSNGLSPKEDYANFAHKLHSNNTGYALRQGLSGNVNINAPSGQPVSICLNGDDVRLGVSAIGNVVVGRESDLDYAGDAIFQVDGDAFIKKNLVVFGDSEVELTGAGTAVFQVAGGAFINGDLEITGNLKINGDATGATGEMWKPSDVRVKEDIRNLEWGLQHLVQVRPVRFRYNGKAGTRAGYEGVGIVGQEMEKFFPDMVRHVSVADRAELDSDDMLMYNDAALTYVLVNAVKELAGKVQKLEAALALATNDAPVSAPDTP